MAFSKCKTMQKCIGSRLSNSVSLSLKPDLRSVTSHEPWLSVKATWPRPTSNLKRPKPSLKQARSK